MTKTEPPTTISARELTVRGEEAGASSTQRRAAGQAHTAAAALAPYAGWEIDLPARATWWSTPACSLFGLLPGSAPSVEETIAFCVPEQRAMLRARLEACIGEGVPYDVAIDVIDAASRRVALRASGRALRIGDGPVIRIQGAFQERGAGAALRQEPAGLAARLANTLDTMSEAFFTIDTALRFTYLNPEAGHLLQRDRSGLIGKLLWEEFSQAIGGASYQQYGRALREGCKTAFEEYYRPLDTWFEVRCYPIEDGLAVYFHDISERKAARTALKKANRALQLLRRCNAVVMRAEQEHELIRDICRMAVDAGGYRLAWVGYAEQDEAHSISIAAHAGSSEDVDCLRKLALGWSDDQPSGRGPAGLAIRAGSPVIVEDMALDLRFSPSSAEAVCGTGSAVYLPLHDDGRAVGLLALYAQELSESDSDEIGLLQELASNLAFGIGAIRSRAEQGKIQASVSKIAASVSTATGERFFEQLASSMAAAVGADGGFVARLLPADPLIARTVIAVMDGLRIADFDYTVADSPCRQVLECEHYVVPAGLDTLFPTSPARSLHGRAYAGWRLHSSAGKPLGIAFVIFRAPVPHSDFITASLRIFAARAAAELERQDADASLRTQASLLDKAQDAIIVRDMQDAVLFWNKGAERMYGVTREEALGKDIQQLLGHDPTLFASARATALATGHWNGEVIRRAGGGGEMVVEVRLSLIRNDSGEAEALLAIVTDISQRKAAEREIERLAFYDPVTALPNRLLLLDRLQHALTVTGRSATSGALLFIDLDNFKTINDTLGHDRGDQMLQQIAQRLRDCVYEIDTVARFGGDEFVVLVESLSQQRHEAATQARHIGERIVAALREPLLLDGFPRHTSASIGVTLFGAQHTDPGELLRQSDLAMYEAKAAGRNGIRFFDPEMQTVVTARAALEADLRNAVQHGEFLLHYQPQIDRDGLVMGAEALIRWQSPQRGLVSPADFIPIAEDTGLIVPMGRWVLQQAGAQLARWAQQPGMEHLSIAVNVSARQLRQPGFMEDVLEVLELAGAAPHLLKIEITESLLVDDTEKAIATMRRLKEHQVGFSLDDFGTGYSSLSYLRRLPLDQLKIDQSFVHDVQADASAAAIVQTILALVRNLRLFVIAEGVETAQQHAFLKEHGCDGFQGYLFSRPVPIEQFEEFARGRGTVQRPNARAR